MAGSDSLTVVIVTLCSWTGDRNQSPSILRCRAQAVGADWSPERIRPTRRRCMHRAAEQSGLELLVWSKARNIHHRGICPTRLTARARNCACNQSAVISPVEANPGSGLPRLILEMGCLIEFFV